MVPNLAAALVKQLEMAVYTADQRPLSLSFSAEKVVVQQQLHCTLN